MRGLSGFVKMIQGFYVFFNAGKEPARLIAVYMGAKGAKDVEPVK